VAGERFAGVPFAEEGPIDGVPDALARGQSAKGVGDVLGDVVLALEYPRALSESLIAAILSVDEDAEDGKEADGILTGLKEWFLRS
jgi:hypothetical protein